MAKVNNKGIYIDFGLDIKSFTQEKNKLMGEIRELQRGLSQIDKQLKFDPTNVTLLKTRITQLKTEINSLTERQKIWANTLEEANKAVERGDLSKTSEQYRTIAIECSKATTQLEYYKNELYDTERALNNNGFALDKFGKNINDSKQGVLDLSTIIKGNLLSDAIKWSFNELISLAGSLKDKFADVMKTGINYNASMETFSVSIGAMLNGDEKAAQGVIDAMKEINSQSAFSNEALLSASQQLIASDISAEEATDSIRNLAKALAYAGKGDDELKRMAQNLNQIQNAGKATAADLKQFAYAGVPIFKLLAEYSDRFKNGVDSKNDPATFEDIAGALEKAGEEGGKFFEAFSIQAETYNGQINKLKSGWLELSGVIASDVTTALTDKFLPAANEALSAARQGYEENGWAGLFDSLIGEVDSFKTSLIELFPSLEPTITGVADFIEDNKEPIETLLSNVKDFAVSDEFQELVTSVADILTDLIGIASGVTTFLEKYKIIEEALNIILVPIKAIHYSLKAIKALIDELNEVGFSGKSKLNFGISPSFATGGGSLGFGEIPKFSSGGFASGGITLNASFNVSGSTNFDRATAMQFAEMLTDEINEGLGGLYR